jgi:hypothetical protein
MPARRSRRGRGRFGKEHFCFDGNQHDVVACAASENRRNIPRSQERERKEKVKSNSDLFVG